MNLLAKRESEFPMELERTFPGVEEFIRNIFGPAPHDMLTHSPWGPVHDLKIGEKEVSLQLACLGHKPEDFDVEITGNLISVKTCCCCEEQHTGEKHHYTFKERPCMNFEESLHLPVKVIGSEAKASYEHGVLHITIPRESKKSSQSRTIKVSCGK